MCPAVRHCLNPVGFVCSSLSQCSGNTGMPSSNVEQRSCVRGGGGELRRLNQSSYELWSHCLLPSCIYQSPQTHLCHTYLLKEIEHNLQQSLISSEAPLSYYIFPHDHTVFSFYSFSTETDPVAYAMVTTESGLLFFLMVPSLPFSLDSILKTYRLGSYILIKSRVVNEKLSL